MLVFGTLLIYSWLGYFPFVNRYDSKSELTGIWFGVLISVVFLILLGLEDIRQKRKTKKEVNEKS